MRPSDVFVFNRVARSLSFSAAAREVGASRATISKDIARLEKTLGVKLLNRSTRSVSLTEAGQKLFRNTLAADAIIQTAIDDIRTAELEATGTVKLSVPSSFGTILLMSIVTRFQTSWPNVHIDIHIEDHATDLIAGGFDLAICVARTLKDSNLISRRLGSTDRVLAAAPGYFEKFGTPRCLRDLQRHRCLGFIDDLERRVNWRFDTPSGTVENACEFPIISNNIQSLIDAACRNDGIIYVPRAFISRELEDERLQRLLSDTHVPQSYGIFAIYPQRNAPAKVRVLLDFIDREMNSIGMIDS